MRLEPDIDVFISAADMNIAVEIGSVLRRGVASKERIAAVLVTYAFGLVRDDDAATIYLLEELIKLNRSLGTKTESARLNSK